MQFASKRFYVAAGGVMMLLVFWAGIKYAAMGFDQPQPELSGQEITVLDEAHPAGQSEDTPEAELQPASIKVYVAGAVSKPDIYEMEPGARVYEAIWQAGPLPEADLASLGMARKLVDGETIYLCQPGEDVPGFMQSTFASSNAANGPTPVPGEFSSYSSSYPLNINTASQDELDRVLPGVGPALAARIVDYRSNNGPFADISDIKNVSGIGDKKYEAIKDMITAN